MLGERARSQQVRRIVQDVFLSQEGDGISIWMPQALHEMVGVAVRSFPDLAKAAAAFGLIVNRLSILGPGISTNMRLEEAKLNPQMVSRTVDDSHLDVQIGDRPQVWQAKIRSDQSASQKENIRRVAHEIRKIGRQEERVASVLSIIFEDRYVGAELIDAYGDDRAIYARRVLAVLRRALSEFPIESSLFVTGVVPKFNDLALVKMVVDVYQKAMPVNRFLILMFLAKYVGRYPDINLYIREKLESSTSMFRGYYRRETIEFLDLAAKKSV